MAAFQYFSVEKAAISNEIRSTVLLTAHNVLVSEEDHPAVQPQLPQEVLFRAPTVQGVSKTGQGAVNTVSPGDSPPAPGAPAATRGRSRGRRFRWKAEVARS